MMKLAPDIRHKIEIKYVSMISNKADIGPAGRILGGE